MDALTDKNVINAGGSLSSKGWVPPLRMTSASVMDVLSLLTDSAWVLWRPRGGVRPLQPTGPTRTGLCVNGRGGVRCLSRLMGIRVSPLFLKYVCRGERARSVEIGGRRESQPQPHTHFGLVWRARTTSM